MDFVHVTDVARANILAAQADATDEVFNVASGVETSLKTVAETLLRIMGSSMTPEQAPERRVNPVPRRLADIARAKAVLGFETSVPLEEGMKSLVAWWRAERLAEVA
jgi:UDP-glucose 4-epimerase